jgi:hypothetical protein
VEDVGLASLRAAVCRADHHLALGPEVELVLYDAEEAILVENEDAFFRPNVDITVLPDRCHVTCSTAGDKGTRFDRNEVLSRLAPALQRRRLLAVEFCTFDEATMAVVHHGGPPVLYHHPR